MLAFYQTKGVSFSYIHRYMSAGEQVKQRITGFWDSRCV